MRKIEVICLSLCLLTVLLVLFFTFFHPNHGVICRESLDRVCRELTCRDDATWHYSNGFSDGFECEYNHVVIEYVKGAHYPDCIT